MKKVVLLVIGLLLLLPYVSGYQVNIDAPETLTVGKPLIVTGTTTFGIGTPIDVVLYYQLTTSTEIKRKIVYIQPDKSFKAIFDTTGLKKGMYKVEVPVSGLGDSFTMRIVQLVDRADEIYLASSSTQPNTGKMYVAGTAKGSLSSGIQVEVFDPDGNSVFGPQYVNTNYAGDFSVDVPVSGPGDYEISFTDAKGYIGAKTITIVGTSTFSETTPASAVTTEPVIRSSHARSSRESPAYFIVRPKIGPVSLYTSSSVDWVIEYIDEKGLVHMVNDQGELNVERVELVGKGKPLYLKIYPYSYSVDSEVFLYGENVNSLVVSPTVPAAFAAQATPPPTEAPQTPVNPLLGIAALGIAMLVFTRQNR